MVWSIDNTKLDSLAEQIATLFSITFLSMFIAIIIYALIRSWYEGKERALIKAKTEREEALKEKRLKNLKLENLEITLTNEDLELLNLMTGSNGTVKGTLRNILRDYLKSV